MFEETISHNRTFFNMQQMNVIEMLPGSYRYANRREQRPLHPDFVSLVMEQQFSTVFAMHKDQVAHVARLQQTTDEFLTEYRKKTHFAQNAHNYR